MTRMYAIAATVLLALGANPYQDATRAALSDMSRIQPAARRQIRYIMLTGPNVTDRQEQAAAVSYTLNAVSRTRKISVPRILGADWRLMRVQLVQYVDRDNLDTWYTFRDEWEKLTVNDPYFHIRSEFLVGKKTVIRTVDGGWVGLPEMLALQRSTSSKGPILRADYFVANILGDAATYYRWAGIPDTEKELLAFLGIDRKAIDRLAADSAANLFISGVTHKPRRVIHLPSPNGSYWKTKDVNREGNNPAGDPVRNPINFKGQRFVFQASEVFFSRPNHLWGTSIYDAAGNRQNVVPPDVALDRYGQGGVGEIGAHLTCIRCHENEGSGGMQPFRDVQVTLPLGPYTDPKVRQRIEEIYQPNELAFAITIQAQRYASAVEACTLGYVQDEQGSRGMTPLELTGCVSRAFSQYKEDPVTLDTLEWEIGLPRAELKQSLAVSSDPIVQSIATVETPVTREAYQSAFHEIMLLTDAWRLRR